MKHVGYALVTGFSALYVLLGMQAEPVTATLAYIAAGMLMMSVVVSIAKGNQK